MLSSKSFAASHHRIPCMRANTGCVPDHCSRIEATKQNSKKKTTKQQKQRQENIVVLDIMYCTYQNTTLAWYSCAKTGFAMNIEVWFVFLAGCWLTRAKLLWQFVEHPVMLHGFFAIASESWQIVAKKTQHNMFFVAVTIPPIWSWDRYWPRTGCWRTCRSGQVALNEWCNESRFRPLIKFYTVNQSGTHN